MRKSDPKYPAWRKRKQLSDERKRTRGNKSSLIMGGSTGESKRTIIRRVVPVSFSIINNPDETVMFLNETYRAIVAPSHLRKEVKFDFSKTESITVDAIMYLTAIIKNMVPIANKQHITRFFGNEPVNPKAREAFLRSGFLNFVSTPSSTVEMTSDHVQIRCDDSPNVHTISEICTYVQNTLNVKKRDTMPLYELIMELSKNVLDHAYSEKITILMKRNWYSYVEQGENGNFRFTFLDTGHGIWQTMSMKWSERMIAEQYKTVISALNGDFRTQTKLRHRGNGLPSVKQHLVEGRISNLTLITNKAFCFSEDADSPQVSGRDISESLKGTVYYWETSGPQLEILNA